MGFITINLYKLGESENICCIFQASNMQIQGNQQRLYPWKSMVGRWISFWGDLIFPTTQQANLSIEPPELLMKIDENLWLWSGQGAEFNSVQEKDLVVALY